MTDDFQWPEPPAEDSLRGVRKAMYRGRFAVRGIVSLIVSLILVAVGTAAVAWGIAVSQTPEPAPTPTATSEAP